MKCGHFFLLCGLVFLSCQSPKTQTQTGKGYKGIWFTLGQFYEHGDKYSGGLGTYTAKHHPLAIYAAAVNRTFFVYGGTTAENERHLLCMIGSYDHATGTLSEPVVVHDKEGVDDPHDNPSLSLDQEGYLWVFVSGRGRHRPGFKYKSLRPFQIDTFERISEEEMTYPQPWYLPDQGFLHLFTKYTGVRELYFETSKDGLNWTEDQKLVGIRRPEDEKGGHYQISNRHGHKVATFFSWHPNGNVDQRTNLYYLQTTDFGQTWTTAAGEELALPIAEVDAPARLIDYHTQGQNVYLKDLNFDAQGNPMALYLTSQGHEPGPENAPRDWHLIHWDGQEWQDHLICRSDHNYDMGSLFVRDQEWLVIAPTEPGPQPPGGGGEIVIWRSRDQGNSWQKEKQITQHSPRNHNYIRRVVNGQDDFYYFWADGNPDTMSRSELYFGTRQGAVKAMPYGE
jgi:hypothetical protein